MADLQVIAQKCKCNSVWCKKCFTSRHSKKHMEELREFDWKRTRQIVLTVNPLRFRDGQEAYEHITRKKLIHNLIRNIEEGKKVRDLNTHAWKTLYKPLKIRRWKWFLEWYQNGFPHLHLFIETELMGRAGMVGGDRIRYYWDIARMIKEKPVKSESHWMHITGYFGKNGYFSKGKQHQIELPSWAQNKPGLKIRRSCSSVMKKDEKASCRVPLPEPLVKEPGCIVDSETGEIKYLSGRKKPEQRTYKARFESCGKKTRIKISDSDTYIFGLFDIPYSEIRSLPGEFKEGKGYSFSVPELTVLELLDKIEKVYEVSFRAAEFGEIERRFEKWRNVHIERGFHDYYRVYA